jgi:hypothetical protein
LSKFFLSLLIGSFLFSACSKDNFAPVQEACELQTGNPAGRSYAADSVVSFVYTQKHCGILPLSSRNYWIYQDSVFNDGVFQKVQYDTLQYLTTKKSLTDGLVWWKGTISVGLPDILYANDSTFFGLEDRLFTPGIIDVKKEFGLFAGDSLRYLTSFQDAAAQGRSLKTETVIKTSAGTFNDCIYFEKNARSYRKDQVYFEPGLGVIKYIQEKAPIGTRIIKLQQVSTLVAYHIE